MKGLLGTAGLALALALAFTPARAAEYRIGKEDVIGVSVWLHPELERTLTVNAEGNVALPPVGEIHAEGLTARELGERLAERLGAYLRQPTQVTATVTQFNSNSVYVSGAVSKPGRYGFESIPGLVEVIGTAGGATAGADLSQVQVIRRDGEARRTLLADVASYLRSEGQAVLPELKPGDTVVVPASMVGGAGGAGGGGEVVAVLGEVQKPGLYAVGAGQDILQVLSQAGGATPRADLKRARVVARTGGSQTVFSVDVRRTIEHGSANPFVVRAGDVVVLTPTGASTFSQGWAGFTTLLTVSRDVLNIALLNEILTTSNTTTGLGR
jgi:polysaccharide export outer membrane protein